MAENNGDKTEPATPRHRQEAMDDGHFARSQDLTAAVLLLAGLLATAVSGAAARNNAALMREKLLDYVATLRPRAPAGIPRPENISDIEIREIQAAAGSYLPTALINIGTVMVGCPCEDGARASNKKYSQRAGAVEAVLTHVIRHTLDTMDAEKPYDPWERLADMKQTGLRGKVPEGWEFEWLEEELGPLPILGIANCDIADAAAYAMSDADWTGQVATELERRRSDVRWQIDPADRDK